MGQLMNMNYTSSPFPGFVCPRSKHAGSD